MTFLRFFMKYLIKLVHLLTVAFESKEQYVAKRFRSRQMIDIPAFVAVKVFGEILSEEKDKRRYGNIGEEDK